MPTGPHCAGCVQQSRGMKFVQTDGLGTNGILVVGDSPWLNEVREGRPFCGAAGAFLDRIFRRLGKSRSEFLLANSIWCKPLNLGWTDHPERFPEAAMALAHCRPHLDELIDRFQPKVIVTLGGVAMLRVLGCTGLNTRQGYVCSSAYGIPVVPTFHPSFVMQGKQKFSAAMFFAFQRALEVAKGTFTRTPTHYALDDIEAMRAYLDKPGEYLERVGWKATPSHPTSDWNAGGLPSGVSGSGLPSGLKHPFLSVDIETPESGHLDEEEFDETSASYTIVRAGFSHTPGTACSFPWAEPFISVARAALQRAMVLVMWNQSFDASRLQAARALTGKETIHDGMWAWHFLQSDLPKGLGFVAPFFFDGEPWKHLNDAQPAFYNATDNDAALRAYLGSRQALIKQGRWNRFERHCVDALPIMLRMGRTGVLVDREKQQKLKKVLEIEAQAAWERVQAQAPLMIRNRKRYKKLPKDFDTNPGAYEIRQVACSCQEQEPTIVRLNEEELR